jgi:hypothetical protein
MSVTSFCRRITELLLTVSLMLAFASGALAQSSASASIERIEPVVLGGQLAVDVDISLSLNDLMRQALSRGVPLQFSIELQIEQPRWWWLNKTIVDASLERRLSYNTLTQSWRVSTGDLAVTTTTYDDALRALTQVATWPVVLTDRFLPSQQYQGRVRLRLNTDQLARPLQMDSGNRNNWTLASPWKSFEFSIRRDPEAQP